MDSNHRPTDYESAALTAVLRALTFIMKQIQTYAAGQPLVSCILNNSTNKRKGGTFDPFKDSSDLLLSWCWHRLQFSAGLPLLQNNFNSSAEIRTREPIRTGVSSLVMIKLSIVRSDTLSRNAASEVDPSAETLAALARLFGPSHT